MPRAKKRPSCEVPDDCGLRHESVNPDPTAPIVVSEDVGPTLVDCKAKVSDDTLTLHALADACARMFRCEGDHDATGYTEARRRVREILAKIPRPQ